jgi:hypothetical protein
LIGNAAGRNGNIGFAVIDDSSFNLLRSNVACNNIALDAFDDGTGTGNVWDSNKFCSTSGI